MNVSVLGLGMCVCFLSVFIVVSWLFHEDPGLALVSVTIGGSVGQCIMPLIFDVIVSTYALPNAFILVSAIALQCIPCGLLLRGIERPRVRTNDVSVKNVTSSTISTLYRLLSDVLVMLVLTNSFFVSLTGKYLNLFRFDTFIVPRSCIYMYVFVQFLF